MWNEDISVFVSSTAIPNHPAIHSAHKWSLHRRIATGCPCLWASADCNHFLPSLAVLPSPTDNTERSGAAQCPDVTGQAKSLEWLYGSIKIMPPGDRPEHSLISSPAARTLSPSACLAFGSQDLCSVSTGASPALLSVQSTADKQPFLLPLRGNFCLGLHAKGWTKNLFANKIASSNPNQVLPLWLKILPLASSNQPSIS